MQIANIETGEGC